MRRRGGEVGRCQGRSGGKENERWRRGEVEGKRGG